jgi:transcriptional regulator with XRE-family HTH domain
LLCQLLYDTRIAAGLTQVELAAKLGMHQTDVSRVERGIKRVDVLQLHDFLEALGLPMLEFIVELDERLKAMKVRDKHIRPGTRVKR